MTVTGDDLIDLGVPQCPQRAEPPGTPVLQATAMIAICLLALQIIPHPIWTLAGGRIAKTVAGSTAEKYLMWTLAALTVLSVLFVLFGGESA